MKDQEEDDVCGAEERNRSSSSRRVVRTTTTTTMMDPSPSFLLEEMVPTARTTLWASAVKCQRNAIRAAATGAELAAAQNFTLIVFTSLCSCTCWLLFCWRRRRKRLHEWTGKARQQPGNQARQDSSKKFTAGADDDSVDEAILQRKRDFVRRAGDRYGYANSKGGHIDQWRPTELPGLILPLNSSSSYHQHHQQQHRNNNNNIDTQDDDENDELEVYLDYAGSALPVQSQLLRQQQRHSKKNTILLANPHSTGPSAARTRQRIEAVRKRLLDHFDAHPAIATAASDRQHPGYEIVFTSGATEALQLVAKHFFVPENCTSAAASSSPSCHQQQQQQQQQQHYCQKNQTLRQRLVYPTAAHTSVVGMRGTALASGHATFECRPMRELLEDCDSWMNGSSSSCSYCCQTISNGETCDGSCRCREGAPRNLLVLPLECNFNGDRPDVAPLLRRLSNQKRKTWFTLLDVAKAAATGPVSLRQLHSPDFAVVSFYKLFGAPTGLGCLLVKRGGGLDALTRHIRTNKQDNNNNNQQLHSYFGGGSVDAVLADADFAVRRGSADTASASVAAAALLTRGGTPHFRGLAALAHGLDELERRGGMAAIREHATALAAELVRRLRALRHVATHQRAIVIYGDWNTYNDSVNENESNNSRTYCRRPGPTVAFNVKRADGSYVGYNEVAKLAALNRPPIQLRTGCFCNPGACQLALDFSNDDIIRNFRESGHVCGDHIDLVEGGRPTGAIRASFGKDSLWEDLDALVMFLERMFVNNTILEECGGITTRWDDTPREAVISELYIFPIKSCAAQKVQKWPMDPYSQGRLLLDREFALVDSSGTAMRLQAYPQMAFLRPEIDLEARTMVVRAPKQQTIELILDEDNFKGRKVSSDSMVEVCGNRCAGKVWGDFSVSQWFSEFLGVQCWLARFSDRGYEAPPHTDDIPRPPLLRDGTSVAFANEQPLLLISEHAVNILNDLLLSRNQKPVSSRQFRPNVVVRLDQCDPEPATRQHLEDGWQRLDLLRQAGTSVAATSFDVVGPCARCSMVDVDPSSGNKGKTLRALAEYRRNNGQITFGIFLRGSRPSAASSEDPVRDRELVWIQEGDLLSCQ